MLPRFRHALIALGCALTLAGCGGGTKPTATGVQDCGTGHTAANVPVEVEV